MKRTGYALALLLFLTAAMAPSVTAAPQGADLPPLPEWPIIGPILRWLGLVKAEPRTATPAITLTPPSAIKEYTPETIVDLTALWEEIAGGETVRVTLREATLQAMAERWIDPLPGVSGSLVEFTQGAITLSAIVDSSQLESYLGIDVPDFLVQGPTDVRLTFTARAEACAPQVEIESVALSGKELPLAGLVQRTLEEELAPLWKKVCIEAIEITDDALIVEGHRIP